MTVGTQNSVVTLEGNGATTAFNYPFIIPGASDAVITYTAVGGAQTVLLTSQYTITGLGNATGGTVTYPLVGSPIAAGSYLTIQRLLPVVQTTSLSNQGPTFASIESALDYVTEVEQQLTFDYSRSIQLNVADVSPLPELPPAAQRAGQFLYFDANGNPAVGAALTGSTVVSAAMQPVLAASTLAGALAIFGAPNTFASISALRAFTGTPASNQLVQGYATYEDGGEGIFMYVPTDSTTPDNGGTVIVDGSGNRYYRYTDRQWNNVRWWGAKGDGSTNDYTALQSAITATGNQTLYWPAGTYVTATTLVQANVGQRWIGAGRETTWLVSAATFLAGDMVQIGNQTNQITGCGISDMGFGALVNRISGHAVGSYGAAVATFERLSFGVTGPTLFGGLLIAGASGAVSEFVNIEDILVSACTGDGIDIGVFGTGASYQVTNLTIEAAQITNCSEFGLVIQNAISFSINNTNIQGSGSANVYINPTAALSQNIVYGSFVNVNCSSATSNDGWLFSGTGGIADLSLTNCLASTNGRHGFNFSGSSIAGITLTNCIASTNQGDGYLLAVTGNISLDACRGEYNSMAGSGLYYGVSVAAGIGSFSITDGLYGNAGFNAIASITNLQGYGIVVASGGSSGYIITNNRCPGNVTGSVSDGGSGTKTVTGNIAA